MSYDTKQIIDALDLCINDGNAPGSYLSTMEAARALLAASAPNQSGKQEDGNCRSCVGDQCVTGPECVTLGRDAAPLANPSDKQEAVAYVRAADLESLADPRIAGKGCFLNKEPREGFVAIYAAPLAQSAEQDRIDAEHRIVCAANRKRFTGEVVLGIRHWDAFMRHIDTEGDPVDQGFIDNKGAYLSRTEAWKVAKEAGQIVRRCGGDEANGGTLYSENLY